MRAKVDRVAIIRRLRAADFTFREIGAALGISYQAAQQALMRADHPKLRRKHIEACREAYHRKHPGAKRYSCRACGEVGHTRKTCEKVPR